MRHILYRWLPVSLWMSLIFFSSAQPDLPTIGDKVTDFSVKKAAHIAEYTILALLLLRATTRSKYAAFYSIAIAALFAISDEFHQSFVPRRESTIRDIVIDVAAAAAALIVATQWLRIGGSRGRSGP